jgi:hypothetical protein
MPNLNNHTIAPQLLRAYREARYSINHNSPSVIELRVGQVNSALVQLMQERQVSTAAVLTAYNPYSESKSQAENAAVQQKLLQDLASHGIATLSALASDPDGAWEPEPSVLALGISQQQAEVLADQYGQNAFVWVNNADGFVSLCLRYGIGIASPDELAAWIDSLPKGCRHYASQLPSTEQSLIMSTPALEQAHWLAPEQWDLNKTWPLARPDGTAMGIGTEMDRMFKLIAAGIQKVY